MDQILFAAWRFYGVGSQGSVKITILRLGACEGTSTVHISTSGVTSGHIVPVTDAPITFAPDESRVVFELQIVKDLQWDNFHIFNVKLTEPSGAQLGPLPEAIVSVTNDTLYPQPYCTEDCSPHRWRVAFIKKQIAVRGIKFWKTTLALGYQGVFGVAESVILKLVIDNALGKKSCGKREVRDHRLAFILAGIYWALFALSHYADVTQQDFRGRSGTRKWLRTCLIDRYLNLSERGSDGIASGAFHNIMIFQVEQLVCDGWYQFLLSIKWTVVLLANFCLQCYLVTSKIPLWSVPVIFVVLPPVMIAVLKCREKRQTVLVNERQDAEIAWVNEFGHLVENRHIIKSFHVVEKALTHFKHTYEDFYNKHRKARFFQQTSKWIPRWCLSIVLVALFAFAPMLVDEFGLSAGDFAALVKSWMSVKKGLDRLYNSQLTLQRSTVALREIADVLNRETRTKERSSESRKASQEKMLNKENMLNKPAAKLMGQPIQADKDVVSRSLLEEIQFKDVDFAYSLTADGSKPTGDSVLRGARIKIPCSGHVILMTGPDGKHGTGKRTMLRLIADNIQPDSGRVLVPPHLTVLLVERRAQLPPGKVLEALRFGRMKNSLSDEVCWAMAEVAGLSKGLLRSTTASIKSMSHRDHVSTGDHTAIALAQALLAEPDILCLDKFGEAMGVHWMEEVCLPLLQKYTEGGLKAVLCTTSSASDVEPPRFCPTVIWSSCICPHLKTGGKIVVNDGQLVFQPALVEKLPAGFQPAMSIMSV